MVLTQALIARLDRLGKLYIEALQALQRVKPDIWANLPSHPQTPEDTLKEGCPPLDAKTWHFIVYHIISGTKSRGGGSDSLSGGSDSRDRSISRGCSVVTAHGYIHSLWNHIQHNTGISVPSATRQSVMAYVEETLIKEFNMESVLTLKDTPDFTMINRIQESFFGQDK
jgi:hypothetical protein